MPTQEPRVKDEMALTSARRPTNILRRQGCPGTNQPAALKLKQTEQ